MSGMFFLGHSVYEHDTATLETDRHRQMNGRAKYGCNISRGCRVLNIWRKKIYFISCVLAGGFFYG